MNFSKGEVRKIAIDVSSRLGQDFVIDSADFVILKEDGTEVTRGYPTIDGHKLTVLYSAIEAGRFICELTFRIGPEILKYKVYVKVV
jgi:hypothetical protein